MRNTITITQCDDDAFIRGTCVEVCVHDGGDRPVYYLAGSAVEDGTTLILPLRPDGEPKGPRWLLADHTVLDAVEEIQTLTPCLACGGWCAVERVGYDLADVSTEECDACDGRGWR